MPSIPTRRGPFGLGDRPIRRDHRKSASGATHRCRMPVCRLLRVLDRCGHLDRGIPGQDLLEEHPQFQPRQIGAQAVVDALSEAQVRVGLRRMSAYVRGIEHLRVAVGRRLPHQQYLPCLDRAAAQFGIGGLRCAAGRRRRRPSQHLLDGRRQRRGIVAQQRVLIRVLGQGQQSARDGIAGGLLRRPRTAD